MDSFSFVLSSQLGIVECLSYTYQQRMSASLVYWTRSLFIISLIILVELLGSIYFLGYSPWRKLRRERLTAMNERSLFSDRHAPSEGRQASSGANQSTNLPLPSLRNYLPNAYISANASATYNKSILAFLHNPKSGGTSIKRCITTLQKLKNESSPVVMATNTASKITEDLLNNVSSPSHYFMGESVIGVCDHVREKPCAYFTMVREPFERTISHYYFCRGGGPSWPPCNNTLEEFTLSLCSVLFRQLTLRILCNQSRQGHVLSWQCNNRPMTIDYLPFDHAQRGPVLEYILQNLENIFAVVGILEEFETSLKLFEYTFGEPFYEECRTKHSNSGSYVINGAKSHQRRSSTREMIRDEEKRKLMQNPDIRRCLYEDVQIYKKIKEIFNQQEIIYNKVVH